MGPNQDKLRERIITADDYEEVLGVTWIGPGLVRLEEGALFADAQYHDIIQVEPQADGSFKLLRVASRSGLGMLSWIVAPSVFELPEVTELLKKVESIGGRWEACGGILTLNVPPEDLAALKAEFELIERRVADGMT